MNKHKINATHYEGIPVRPGAHRKKDHRVNAIIETPKNSLHKYALNADYGIIAFHEVLPESMQRPNDYGFIPQTLAADGDLLDILVTTHPTLLTAGTLIRHG